MLKKIIAKPHLFFFGLVPLFLILGLFKRESYINLKVNYLNFDLDISLLCYISSVFFLLIGFNYFSLYWVQKYPKKALTISHIVLQLFSITPFILIVFSFNFSQTYLVLVLSFIIFLFSIIIHLINFFTSLFLKTK